MATITLTTSYKKIAVIELKVENVKYGEFRTYAKYTKQDPITNKTTYYLKSTYYVDGDVYSYLGVDTGTAELDGTTKKYKSYTRFNAGETVIQEVPRTITHNDDGSSPTKTIKTSWDASFGDTGESSAVIKMPTIKRLATVTSATDFTDEENPTLEFSNPASFTIKPYLNFYDNDDNLVHQIIRDEEIESPYVWDITTEERKALWEATNKQKTYRVTVGVDTYNEDTKLGYNAVSKTMTYINAIPTQSTIFEETSQKVSDVLGNSKADILVQNASKVKLVTTPSALKGAAITEVQMIHNNIAIANTEYTFNVANSIFQTNVTDSRGFVSTQKYTKNIIEYLPIEISSFKFKRENPTSSKILLTSQIRYKQATFNLTENAPTIQWKMGTDGELNTLTADDYTIDTDNNKITISNLSLGEVLPYTEEKRFYLYVNDLLTEDTENEPVLRGIPTCDMGEHDFQVNGDLFVADTNRTNKVLLNMSGKISKNLFDKNNVNALQGYIVSSNPQIVGSDTGRTFFIKCKPNTTYTISKLASRLNVGYAINKPSVGGKVYSVKYGIANETTELTYTTGYDAKYLVVFYHVSTIMSPSEQEVLDSIQVEKGPIATKYEDYFEPALLIRNSDGIFQEISPRKIRLTFNHDYVYTTDLQYDCFKIGKMVFLNIYTIAFSKAIPSLTDFIYGLPKPTEYIVFALHGHMTAQGDGLRCGLDNFTGNIKTHYDGPEYYGSTSGTQYSCILIYETEE